MTKAVVPLLCAFAMLLAGCMDPSIYQSYGTAQPPQQTPRAAIPMPTPEPGKPARPGDKFWSDMTGGGIPAQSPDNVGIIVEKIDLAELNEVAVGLDFEGRRGDAAIRAIGSPVAQRNGLRIGLATDSLRARLSASAQRRRNTSRQQMLITVLNGHEGTLIVGNDVYVDRLTYWTPQGYQVLIERAFVGRSLAVRPRILEGGMIEVELWPRFTTRQGRVLDLTQLATKVVVRDGQTLFLGGLTTGGTDVGAVLFGLGSRTQTGQMAMLLTAKIGGIALDWPKGKW